MDQSPRLVIGCPVRRRGWILPAWKEATEIAVDNAGMSAEYCFVAGEDDLESLEPFKARVVSVSEEKRPDVRMWNESRYEHMVRLRNRLLDEVRIMGPDLFLSLDSDILLHPDAIANMYSSLLSSHDLANIWAVGGKLFMTTAGTGFPSYGKKKRGSFERSNSNEVMSVDVIMACKLMTPMALAVDYRYHTWGEDAGWSAAVQEQGGNLLWDGRVTNKHVMEPSLLNVMDKRCGY